MDAIKFLASFPDIQSAIKIGRDSMRIQLDIPESEVQEAVKLLALRDVVLRVEIKPE
jgi:hypothetical protein